MEDGKVKSWLWYCPLCNQPFKTQAIARILTVRCPHCGETQNIRELHEAGKKMIYAGLASWALMLVLTDDIEPVDNEEVTFRAKYVTTIEYIKYMVDRLAKNIEVHAYDENHREYVEEKREQNSYHEKYPDTILPKGKVTPFSKPPA
jgi:hypothetical protein